MSKPSARQVKERVTALKQEKAALGECWSNRNDQLQEGLNLQVHPCEYNMWSFYILVATVKLFWSVLKAFKYFLLFCVTILSLQVFIRDAEYVDSVTASQITFVSSEDLGVCILTNFIYSSSLIDHFTSV